jgi:hypothetical protein
MDYIGLRRKRRKSGAVIELLGLCHLALDIMGGWGNSARHSCSRLGDCLVPALDPPHT